MLNNCGEAFNLYLPSTLKKLVTTWTINCKIFFGSIVFSRVWSSAGIGHQKAILIFIKDLLEDEQGLSMGGMLVLLKYLFYPLFILNNGMNSISKSLTVLTRPNYWSFSHMHIYFGGTSFLQVFRLFWSMKWRGPWSSANTEKDKGQNPKEGPKTMLIRSPFMHIHPPREPKGPSPWRWDQDLHD